jgi:hypothetical protein
MLTWQLKIYSKELKIVVVNASFLRKNRKTKKIENNGQLIYKVCRILRGIQMPVFIGENGLNSASVNKIRIRFALLISVVTATHSDRYSLMYDSMPAFISDCH